MSIYTVSVEFLKRIKRNELHYFYSILFSFLNDQNSSKMAVDRNLTITNIYSNIKNNADLISEWLAGIARTKHFSIEIIDVEIDSIVDDEDKTLKLCSSINGPKCLIVYSLNSCRFKVNSDYCTIYDGSNIRILDRDEANSMINSSGNTVNNYTNSIVAGGDVSNSTNNN